MNKLILIAFLSLFLNACAVSNYISDITLTPYKADIHQGSALDRFTVNQLKLGMSNHQVQDLIGPPSITDPFHNNQWDYINHSTLGSGEIVSYRLTLTFKQEKLVNINTDGIIPLPALTFIEKVAESKRIDNEKAAEKAKIIAMKLFQEKARIAKEKAKIMAMKITQEKARVAKEKAKIAAIKLAQEKTIEKAKAEKEKAQRIMQEKIAAIKLAQEKALKRAKVEKVAKDIANAKIKALEEKQIQEKNKSWYKFW
ncbi:MAG: outer membrane protein assembly factor BamE [Gammaproteobacteria bacterium]|nr:outer membrane protein assembly factor BamE [Gammaproteobacteria bacterium]